MIITKDGTVKIRVDSFATAFAKYTFERFVKQRGISLDDKHNEIYWATRKNYSLDEINKKANEKGLVDYTLSMMFSPNYFYYDQCLLQVVIGQSNNVSYVNEESLKFLASLGYDGTVEVHPPLQECEKEEYCIITIKNGNINREWFDLN